MALRRRAPLLTALALAALSISGVSAPRLALAQPAAPPPAKPAAQPPPPAKPPAPPPPAGKKADVEFDPDAKPKEAPPPPPLPPPEPGQWGVGGTEEEGKFSPENKRKKDEEARKAKEAEEDKKPADLGPERRASLDTVIGFGGMRYIVDNKSTADYLRSTTGASFVFGFTWRVAEIWTLGARFPFTRASVAQPGSAAYNTFASGNLELLVSPSFQLTSRMRLPAQVSLFLPTAQGDHFPKLGPDQKIPVAQQLMNQSSSYARGWEEMPLFATRRVGFRLAGGITYDSGPIHVTAGTKIDLMLKVGGGDPYTDMAMVPQYVTVGATYAWVTHGSFHYSFLDGRVEPGLRAWLAVAKMPVHTLLGTDESGVQFVLEPQVNGRFPIGVEKKMAVKAGLGMILPVSGPLGGAIGQFGTSIKGFRINAAFDF